MTSKEQAIEIARILDNKKALKVTVLHVEDITVMADYLVIASGSASTHVKSLAEEAEFQMKEKGIEPIRIEGFNTRNWFVLDYGSVIVHVFDKEAREFYNLEHLWADGTPVPLDFAE